MTSITPDDFDDGERPTAGRLGLVVAVLTVLVTWAAIAAL